MSRRCRRASSLCAHPTALLNCAARENINQGLRDETGDVVQARQVSSRPEKVQAFFQQLTRERSRNGEPFVAVVQVCGFNDWLIRMLEDYRCQNVIVIQPEERKRRKTDRRDAAALSELLWVNRGRLLDGKPVRGLRVVQMASPTDQENRRLAVMRKLATRIWQMLSYGKTYWECREFSTSLMRRLDR